MGCGGGDGGVGRRPLPRGPCHRSPTRWHPRSRPPYQRLHPLAVRVLLATSRTQAYMRWKLRQGAGWATAIRWSPRIVFCSRQHTLPPTHNTVAMGRYWDQGRVPKAPGSTPSASTAWAQPGFDDSRWPAGTGVLGYGDRRAGFATELNPGTQDAPQTTVCVAGALAMAETRAAPSSPAHPSLPPHSIRTIVPTV